MKIMKIYTKEVSSCSECPNTYIHTGSCEHRSGYCVTLKRRVFEIDDAEYDSETDTTNCFDEIPSDCPLSDLN